MDWKLMRTCYDAIYATNIPPTGADLYLGYDDGAWPDAPAIAAAHPGKVVVAATVFASDNKGDVLDVENGDATAAEAPGWIQMRQAAGHHGPLIYTYQSNRQNVIDAFITAGVALPGLWIADYNGVPALMDPTDVACQYQSNTAYDVSIVVDYLPGIDPPPTPPTAKDNETVTTYYLNGQLHVFGVVNNVAYHWWQTNPPTAADPNFTWHVEVLSHP